MTQPSAKADASNARFRDLADVLLLRDLVEDLAAVRAACVEVFAFRGTHEWPPALEPMAFWEDLYAELAAGLELAEKTLEEAVREARAFIESIDAAGAQQTPLRIRGALPHLRNLQLRVVELDPVGLHRRAENFPEHLFHRRRAGVPESEEVEVSRHPPLQVPDVEQPRALEDEAVCMRGAGQTIEEALRREPNENHVEVRVRLLREPQETRLHGSGKVRRLPPRRTHEMIASR